VSLFSGENASELDRFWREMAPVPGRLAASLRFALMSALATLVLLILQPSLAPVAPSLFMLFLASHETPRLCLRDLLTMLSGAAMGTTAALLLIAATGNEPMARVLGLGVFTFLAAFFFRTSAVPAFPMAFGCLAFFVINFWENHLPAERLLHLSLWPMGTLATVALSATVVEYLFNRSEPLIVLRRELNARCAALGRLFELYATHADAEEIDKQSAIVRRYAVTGEGQLHVLLERASKDGDCDAAESSRLKAATLAVDRLLVLSAALAINRDSELLDTARVGRIGNAIVAAGDGRLAEVHSILADSQVAGSNPLDRIEQTLRRLGDCTQPSAEGHAAESPQAAPSGASWRDSLRHLLLPDAFSNEDYFLYALKLSLCATICFVIYVGLKWPGINNAYFTVYFTGLSTTGTTNRKLLLRLIGSTLGGMILGIGCMVFVYPNLEGVQGFLLVIAAVSFLEAWIAGSPYFGYIGLQAAYSFNLTAFERFGAANQMTPARDRLLGIALGFLVMFLIFHQVRPERTVDTMRRLLARLLRASAELIRLVAMPLDAGTAAKMAEIRKQAAGIVASLPNFAHAVKFEFPPDRAPGMKLSDEILNAAAAVGDLVFCVGAWPAQPGQDQRTERLAQFRTGIESGLRDLACSLESAGEAREEVRRKIETAAEDQLQDPMPASVAKAMDHFRELRMACDEIAMSAE